MKRFISLIMMAAVLTFLTGCLTVEKKMYSYKFNKKGEGKLEITYFNIVSEIMEGDSIAQVLEEDYASIYSEYIEGGSIESDFHSATNITKKLYKDGDKLCAKVTMELPNLEAGKIYKLGANGPIVINVTELVDSETYISSNGTYVGDYANMIYWENSTKKLEFETSIVEIDPEMHISLLETHENSK